MKISITHQVNDVIKQELSDQLRKHNSVFVDTSKWGEIAVYSSNQQGKIIGGLLGTNKGLWFFIDLLWIDEDYRKAGLGSELVNTVLKEVVTLGCQHAFVDTYSFQALPFYQNLGFELQMTLNDFPITGISRHYLSKQNLTIHDE